MNENTKNILSKSIFIVLVTALAYLISYNYDVGYNEYYGIPAMYIELETTDILKIGTNIISSILLWVFILNLVPAFLYKGNNPIFLSIEKIILFLGVNIFFCYMFNFNTIVVIMLAIYFFILVFIEFIGPLIFFYKTKGYKNKLIKATERDRAIKDLTILEVALKKTRRSNKIIILLLLLILVLTPFVRLIGMNSAMKKVEYLTIEDSINSVIILDDRL